MKIASFLQACKLLKYNPKTVLPNVTKMPKHKRASTIARAKLEIITEAANEGKEFDYEDWNQQKWYPYFRLDKPGFRFGGTCYPGTAAGCGPRLCFHSSDDAEYHGKKHLLLYKAAMTKPKRAVRKSVAKKKK